MGGHQESTQFDYAIGALLVGPVGVGKSSALLRFTKGTFVTRYTPTTGFNIEHKIIAAQGGQGIGLACWDIAVNSPWYQTHFKAPEGESTRTKLFFIFADITQDLATNIDRLQPFLKKIDESCEDAIKVLVVSKDDLSNDEKKLSDTDIAALKAEIGCQQAYVMSAQTGKCSQIMGEEGKRKEPDSIDAMFRIAAEAVPRKYAHTRRKKSKRRARKDARRWPASPWNALTGTLAGGFLLAGSGGAIVLALLMAFGVMAPFAFLGFGGSLAILVSALFVFEVSAALAVLALCCTTAGPRTMGNTLSYISRHLFNGKLQLFLLGIAVLALMLLLMVPALPLASAALPLFTSGTVFGSAVLVIAFLAGYTVLFAVAERVIALGFVAAINDANRSKNGLGVRTLLGVLGSKPLAGITGNTEHQIECRLGLTENNKPLRLRFWPALGEAAKTGKDVEPPDPVQRSTAPGSDI